MQSESREVVGAAVASTARIMSTRWMWISVIPGVVAVLFTLSFVSYHAKKGFPHGVGASVITDLIVTGVPLLFVVWTLLRARRYAQLAKVATDDSGVTWFLTGNIIAASRDGVPHPELAFKIAGYLRRSLTAVPLARLVQ